MSGCRRTFPTLRVASKTPSSGWNAQGRRGSGLENVALVPDEITKAANGQIVLTAIMLYAFKMLRSDGFYKQQTQHA